MIKGEVREQAEDKLVAFVTVSVEGADNNFMQCEVTLDTGFTGWLLLPQSTIRRLGLISRGRSLATLANGEVEEFDYYITRVLWLDSLRPVIVFESTDQALLGMALLSGCRLVMDVWRGGDISIEQAFRPG